jgi:hypothetical protein
MRLKMNLWFGVKLLFFFGSDDVGKGMIDGYMIRLLWLLWLLFKEINDSQ